MSYLHAGRARSRAGVALQLEEMAWTEDGVIPALRPATERTGGARCHHESIPRGLERMANLRRLMIAPRQSNAQHIRSTALGIRYRFYMAAFLLSSVGTGVVLPFTAVYIDSVLKFGAGGAAAYFAVSAATSLTTGLAAGGLVDRIGARVVGVIGAGTMAIGYIVLGLATTRTHVILSAVAVGSGLAFFQPAFTPTAARLVPEPARRKAFAVRNLVMNVGLGIGAALATVVTRRNETLRALFMFDAASYVPLALALWVFGGPGRSPTSQDHRRNVGYRRLLTSRPFLWLSATQLLVWLFGFAQLNSSVPLLIHGPMGESTKVIGAIVVANTVAVVALQYPLARWFERFSVGHVLTLTGLMWAVAFGSGAAAAAAAGQLRYALLFVFAVVFAIGEAAYSSSFFVLLTQLAPEGSLGRATGVTSLAVNAGSIAGPAIGIVLISHLRPTMSWSVLGVAAALPFVAAGGLNLSMKHRVDDATPSVLPFGPSWEAVPCFRGRIVLHTDGTLSVKPYQERAA